MGAPGASPLGTWESTDLARKISKKPSLTDDSPEVGTSKWTPADARIEDELAPIQLLNVCRLLALTAFPGMGGQLPVVDTVTGTLVTQKAPSSPHEITLIVCVPMLVATEVRIESPLIAAVSGLLSSEYPIAVSASDDHVVAVADSENGD